MNIVNIIWNTTGQSMTTMGEMPVADLQRLCTLVISLPFFLAWQISEA